MTQFTVDHSAYEASNTTLLGYVNSMGDILNDLNRVLGRMDEAVEGKALPLWADLQRQWDSAYVQMNQELAQGHAASVKVADTYAEGDSQGARIVSS